MKTRRLLIAEDSNTQALRLQAVLEAHGYSVDVVSNGRQALEKIRQQFYPLVITDWVMPEMNGIEFCQALRDESLPGYVYVILLTAKDDRDDLVTGLEAGADDYLVKPVHPAELVARLKTAWRILELEAELKRNNEEIRRLSIMDPLTQVYNRRYLNQQLPIALKTALRYRRPLTILMADIDHFKKVNDTYGHMAGDEVLQAFAQTLGNSIRKDVDWTARYGGEEFVVVMPETAFDGGLTVAERIRLLTAYEPIDTAVGPVPITASFGVAALPADKPVAVTTEQLMATVDACLYRAKENGRNCVEGQRMDN